jgi:F-type H+-transporting ATPase subunit a
MVLLFVISALAPIANIAFFGLEMFIGPIQAFVFAILSVIFMMGATESHHDDHGEHH